MKKKRKIKKQTIFCTISLIIFIGCVIFYGVRFYLAYSKYHVKESGGNTLLMDIKSKDLKSVGGEYYFYNNPKDNYVEYSNIIWRILKINKDNQIVLVSEDILTTLAYGEEVDSIDNSNIIKWLNTTDKEGVLDHNLNSGITLNKTSICIDKVDKASSKTCKKTNKKYNIGLPSVSDYINSGSTKGFMSNDKYYYLSNVNTDGEIWYVAADSLSTTDGSDLYGIKPTITLSSNIEIKDGKGTKDSPYKIEDSKNMFGSYVKLGDNTYRVYNENEETLDLVLMDEIDSTNLYYSTSNYYNTKTKGTYAYYLNTTFLNKLDYADIINIKEYNNGYYGVDNNYDLDTSQQVSKVKVGITGIGDILLNSKESYSTMTNERADGELVYVINNNGTVFADSNKESNSIVPVININKSVLTKGVGTKNEPYEKE